MSLSSGVIVEGTSLARLLELIQDKGTLQNAATLNFDDPCLDRKLPASIELRSLTYERDGKCLFDRLSVEILPGKCVAFRGANGSGKSTLIGLIYGAEPALQASIFVNGFPLSNLNIANRCDTFSFLPQDILLITDTLRNNITMGRIVSDEVITKLCLRLGLKDFLQQWPQRLDSWIDEGGRNISGGERQRIGLLRALILKSPVLLLDEPEQNLDAHSLQCLVTYLTEIKQFCTCLMVTHSKAFDHVIDQTVNLGIEDG